MLQLFCEKLDVADLEEVVPTLQRLTVTADAYPRLEQVLWLHISYTFFVWCKRKVCFVHSSWSIFLWIGFFWGNAEWNTVWGLFRKDYEGHRTTSNTMSRLRLTAMLLCIWVPPVVKPQFTHVTKQPTDKPAVEQTPYIICNMGSLQSDPNNTS